MEDYIGMLKVFAGNFAPQDWLFCNGQLLSTTEYAVLFRVIGNTYGGDGITTFAVPNLNSRLAIGAGKGTNLSPVNLGEQIGSETVTLSEAHLPSHNHPLIGSGFGNVNTPHNQMVGVALNSHLGHVNIYNTTIDSLTSLSESSISASGGGQAHNNIQPSLGLNYIICYSGIYPDRE